MARRVYPKVYTPNSSKRKPHKIADGETYVVALVVVDGDLAEHGVVLHLALAQGRAVASDQDELGLAIAKRLDRLLVAELDLSGLDDKGKTRADGVGTLLGLRSHCVCGRGGTVGSRGWMILSEDALDGNFAGDLFCLGVFRQKVIWWLP